MTNLERIENYYNHALSDAERAAFEAELKSNAALAEEVAFYVQARAAAQAEARARRLEEFKALGTQTSRARSLNFAYTWAAAAYGIAVELWCVLVVFCSTVFPRNSHQSVGNAVH